ncbi:hypothetical protein OAB00_01920 [Akkermansiaceae bacterium]|nr:hypothetical protein [Akkermansiaceae bacterium]
MKLYLPTSLSLGIILTTSLTCLSAETTQHRQWTSADGKKVTARATAYSDGKATFLLNNGKSVTIDITTLSRTDQAFIKFHFDAKEETTNYQVEPQKKDSDKSGPEEETETPETPQITNKKGSRKQGGSKIEGPESSGETTFYYHYKPSSAEGVANPSAILWTGGGRAGNAKDLQLLTTASELTGMVLLACGNSSNSGKANYPSIDANLKHAMEKYSIDEDRVFSSGASGGAARAFRNAKYYKMAGAMPLVGHTGAGLPSKSGFYYVITGAHDFNRYASSWAAKQLGRNATVRLGTGGHNSRDAETLNDGIIWLYTRNAYDGKADETEIANFEDRFYTYLTEDLADKPYRAYYWTDHLLNTCKIQSSNKSKFQDLHDKLESDEKNVLYLKGREDLVEFAEKELAPIGEGSKYNHTTKSIQSAAAKLKKEYEGVPWVSQIAAELQKKTDK